MLTFCRGPVFLKHSVYMYSVKYLYVVCLSLQFVHIIYHTEQLVTISLRKKETHKEHSKNIHKIAIKHKVKANLLLASYSPEHYKNIREVGL